LDIGWVMRHYSPINAEDSVGEGCMFDAEMTQNQKTAHLFCLCVILLTGMGLVTLYSASYSFASRFFGEGNYFIVRQLVYCAAGIVFFIISSMINLNVLRKFLLPLVIIAASLCVLTFIPGIGVERYGASRWIEFGAFTYQPSEMVKFALPLYLAHLLDKKSDNLDNFYSGVLPPVLVTGIFFGLIYRQNNFSTAIFIVINALIIFFLAGIRFRYFFAAITMIIPVSALLVFTKEYRVRRLVSFLRPQWDSAWRGVSGKRKQGRNCFKRLMGQRYRGRHAEAGEYS